MHPRGALPGLHGVRPLPPRRGARRHRRDGPRIDGLRTLRDLPLRRRAPRRTQPARRPLRQRLRRRRVVAVLQRRLPADVVTLVAERAWSAAYAWSAEPGGVPVGRCGGCAGGLESLEGDCPLCGWSRQSGRPVTVAGVSRAHAWAGPETSASRIRRHSCEEIYVQVSRHARHGRLTFSGLRAKDRQKCRRTARPRRRSRANRTTAPLSSTSTTAVAVPAPRQLQYQYHAVAVPAPRQFEVAGPTSGCRASPQQYVPSHVFGAMKSRGVPTPADRIEVRDKEVRGKGGPYTVGSPAAGRVHRPARTPQFPSNERWSPVTLTRSSHPALSNAAGADTTTRRCCR